MQAAGVYRAEPCARPLWMDLEAHLVHGVVISVPRVFVMGRRVRHDWTDEQLLDPWLTDDERGDCWHVWLASGPAREVVEAAPARLPWVSWERAGKVFRVRTERVERALQTGMAEGFR